MSTTSVTTTTTRASAPADREAIVAVLASAFAEDPVFAWAIPGADRRTAILPGLFTLFADAYEPLRAVRVAGGSGAVVGAALWAPPGTQAVADEDAAAFAGELERVCGADIGRVLEVIALLEEQHPTQACHYLNLLGVDPAFHGRGIGSALLDDTLRRCDAAAEPAYLEATSPRNRRLYARHGFEVVGEIALPDGPSLWRMWREPR